MYNRNRPMAVVYETETPHAPRTELGPYREAEYLELPEQPRCELLYGRLPVTPAPSLRHQDVVGWRSPPGRLRGSRRRAAVVSPVDVVLAEHSIVQPDVVYVSNERAWILRQRVEGAPDLVVEILSPGTARRDLGEKLRLYAESGVAEYWIVDPILETFEFLENDGRVPRAAAGGRRLPFGGDPGLELDLEAFWRSIPAF